MTPTTRRPSWPSIALTAAMFAGASVCLALPALVTLLATSPDTPRDRVRMYWPAPDTCRYVSVRDGVVNVGQISGLDPDEASPQWVSPFCHDSAMVYVSSLGR